MMLQTVAAPILLALLLATLGARAQTCGADTFVVGKNNLTYFAATSTTLHACSQQNGTLIELCESLSQKQTRVSNSCRGGEAMVSISAVGVATCDRVPQGTVTGVLAGPGISVAASPTVPRVSVNYSEVQSRVLTQCPSDAAIGSINMNGTAVCVAEPWILVGSQNRVFAPSSTAGNVGIGVAGNPRGRLDVSSLSGTFVAGTQGAANFLGSNVDVSSIGNIGVAGVSASVGIAPTGVVGVGNGLSGAGVRSFSSAGYRAILSTSTYAGAFIAPSAGLPTNFAYLADGTYGADVSSLRVREPSIMFDTRRFQPDLMIRIKNHACISSAEQCAAVTVSSPGLGLRTRIQLTNGTPLVNCAVLVTNHQGSYVCSAITLDFVSHADIICVSHADSSEIIPYVTVVALC